MSTAVATKPKRRGRAPAPPDVDPVTQYARDVRSGEIVAGRAVRLACERHLKDLKRQKTAAFPYRFDPAAARHIIEFFPKFLVLETGDPFVLPPWLQFSYGCIFGWKCHGGPRDGLRKYQHGFFETSKGSGKTPSAGGVGVYGTAYDDESHGEIYSTGFDKGQASIILNDAIRMVNDSPAIAFKREFIVDKYNIAHPSTGSFFRAMSSQHQSKSGPRPHYVLSDEIHEHRDGTVVAKAESGFKNRKQPLGLKFTNSGSDKTSYCWQLHEKSLQVLEGAVIDEQWFAYVCHLDACDACFADGYRQPKDGCPDCDNWRDQAVWPKIAPALGIVIQPKYLQDAINTADSIPSEFAMRRRLNFCIWTETHQVWIAPDRWDACKSERVARGAIGDTETNNGMACAAGFDMSEKVDLTSCVIAIRVDDEAGAPAAEIELLDMVGTQEVKKKLNINFAVELVPFFWMPEETLRERVQKERISYDAWHRDGWVRASPGPVIDYDLIFEQFTTDIGKRYKPQRVGYDPHNTTQFALQLRDKAKFTIVEVAQGRALSESFKLFEALVLLKRIRHRGNPVMGFCVANAEPKRDRYQNLWIEKPSHTKRIDGLIAAVIALSQLVLLPARVKTKSKPARIWTPDGFKPILPEATHGRTAQS